MVSPPPVFMIVVTVMFGAILGQLREHGVVPLPRLFRRDAHALLLSEVPASIGVV